MHLIWTPSNQVRPNGEDETGTAEGFYNEGKKQLHMQTNRGRNCAQWAKLKGNRR